MTNTQTLAPHENNLASFEWFRDHGHAVVNCSGISGNYWTIERK